MKSITSIILVYLLVSGCTGGSNTQNAQSSTEAKSEKIDSASIIKNKIANEKAINELKKKLRVDNDDMQDSKFYFDKKSPSSISNSNFSCYVSEHKGYFNLRLKINYKGSTSWLFIKKYIIKADDYMKEYIPTEEIKHDNDSENTFEFLDTSVSDEENEFIRKIMDSKTAKIRMVGDDFSADRVITQSEKESLKNVISFYDLVKTN